MRRKEYPSHMYNIVPVKKWERVETYEYYATTVQWVCWYGKLLLEAEHYHPRRSAVGNVLPPAVMRYTNIPIGQ